MFNIAEKIAKEIGVKQEQVSAAVTLLDEGASVPFVARYRKEVTGGLDDTQLRTLEERLGYLRELEDRRQVILKSIDEQEKLTPELKTSIVQAETKSELEDLYLPYKPKRRTKAQIAREAGLQPLADSLLENPAQDPEQVAQDYFNEEKGITDSKSALDGAKQILMEEFAENAPLLSEIRHYLEEHAIVRSTVVAGKEDAGHKFRDYFEYSEQLSKIPSHRALALFRGRNESVLSLELVVDQNLLKDEKASNHAQYLIAKFANISDQGRPADSWLQTVVLWTWRVKLHNFFETELLGKLRETAELQAIGVFASNLRDLLMAAPAGKFTTMGMDPGLRTGVKIVVVDDTGKLLTQSTIFPHAPQNQWDSSIAKLATICELHKVRLVSIGNGTASRETDKLVAELMKKYPSLGLQKIVVNEAGASVYSASKLASEEFPDLDVSYRGSVSIARRLQDPLAELVKIEPKAIGVGQYQHDVSQSQLGKTLGSVVEDCVNAVGVDLNTASAPLLTYVSGLNKTLAQNIIRYREQNGRFSNRKQLTQVERLGPKSFEQAAGFLRITDGDNPLDRSGVHPETYSIVTKMLDKIQANIDGLMGNSSELKKLNAADFVEDKFGLPTINDILAELDKPGRDPRGNFKAAKFKEGVEKISDLSPGMALEGSVTNVTDFGAFVDIGVHQDGLVHISLMSDKFISNPREVVKTGDIVKVHVTEVDPKRKRISLSMVGPNPENAAPRGQSKDKSQRSSKTGRGFKPASQKPKKPTNTAFGMALADALKGKK
ncbi:Tex family protein [Aliikangiella coralliicola]|uniref:RNA-binding transcriptional accessory protein n=1 Tax=Aliikangiella coralliicola TaxID=2592383 RepID=A0A545UI76_9GAMM|nr:Tex family protein [Aliikangiella coralliicola]TQV89162.1 RNA-binding transcriptional accessory protein [Aliikangiella coralliicola]